MTTTEDLTAVREQRREVLNTIIDLLESLPDQQQRTDVIISAAAAVGVNVMPPKASAVRIGYGYRPKHKRSW